MADARGRCVRTVGLTIVNACVLAGLFLGSILLPVAVATWVFVFLSHRGFREPAVFFRSTFAPMLGVLAAFTMRYTATVHFVARWQYGMNESFIEDAIRCSGSFVATVEGACSDRGFLIGAWLERPASIYVHLFGAIVTSCLQIVQFARETRGDRRHAVVGWVAFASLVLSAGGAASILYHSEAGMASSIPLGLLTIFWTGSALRGILTIRRGDVSGHRRWMLRVAALTFTAPMLRVYDALFRVLGASPTMSYVSAEWCALVGNAGCVEAYIRSEAEGQHASLTSSRVTAGSALTDLAAASNDSKRTADNNT